MKKMLLLAALFTLGSTAALADQAVAGKAGCLACHSVDKKIVGPAFKDVAAKYKGQGDALAKLTDKVRKGGAGVWGPIPMPAHPADKISDGDLKSVLEWVLKSA